MKAEVKSMKKQARKVAGARQPEKKAGGSNSGKETKRSNSGRAAAATWMYRRPKENWLFKPRQWNGKSWWYCHPDTGGKCNGEYQRHTPKQCKGRSKSAKRKPDDDRKPAAKPSKIRKAMQAVADDSSQDSK